MQNSTSGYGWSGFFTIAASAAATKEEHKKNGISFHEYY
jgi:hypothetical protein